MSLEIVVIILTNGKEHGEIGKPSVSNSLGLPVDQARHFIWPDLDLA